MVNPKDLSDLFGRFFVIAGYLPALALLTLCRWLIFPALPATIQSQFSIVEDVGYLDEFSLLIIAPVFIAAILVSLTATTVRMYSGRSLFRPGEQQVEKYQEFIDLIEKMDVQKAVFSSGDAPMNDESEEKLGFALVELQQLSTRLMKITDGVIMFDPGGLQTTGLGNVLASLNEYPERRYGMNAGTIWPRLKAVLPKEFEERLKSQNTSFMFMLNLSLCFMLFALVWISFGIASLAKWSSVSTATWLVVFTASCLGGYLFYRLSVAEARTLVETMSSAFDMFRGSLREKLGLAQVQGIEEEKKLWGSLTSFLLLGDELSTSTKRVQSDVKRLASRKAKRTKIKK